MKTFDIHNSVREYLKSYITYVIPSTDGSELEIEKRENLFYQPLSELMYKDAPNYMDASIEEMEAYITEYYILVLSKLNPEEIACKLRDSCLTSNERTDSLAKRHIVSEWLKIYTDIAGSEIGIGENEKVIKLDTFEFIGPMLENVIRKNIANMRGFTSLKALYLFEKSEKLEEEARIFEGDIDSYVNYMHEANFLRCDADMEEYEYKSKNKGKGYVKKYPGLKG